MKVSRETVCVIELVPEELEILVAVLDEGANKTQWDSSVIAPFCRRVLQNIYNSQTDKG